MAAWPIRLNSNNPDKFRRSHTPPHALIRKYSYADRGASPYDQYRNGKTVWLTRNIGKVSYYTLPKEGKTILKRKTKSAGLSKDMAHNDDSEHFTRQAMDKYKNQEGQKLYTVHCECLYSSTFPPKTNCLPKSTLSEVHWCIEVVLPIVRRSLQCVESGIQLYQPKLNCRGIRGLESGLHPGLC